MKRLLHTLLCAAAVTTASAQLSTNPDKFLGNITTSYNVDAGGGIPVFYKLWNQITCENESKWSSVEGTKGSFNWSGADRAFNYAKQHNFTYKFHALVWGSQYPGWLESLSANDRLTAMTNWFDKAKAKYKTLPMIDVVNEAVGNHQPGNPMMKETLGGGGKTGYDWLIKAFEMAYERWPNSILIYNDYNSLRWDVDNYITLVQTLRNAGAPIDAYGNQSHDVNDISSTELSNVLKKQQDALKMPMFITELDIDKADDEQQKAQYKTVLPLMWEAPYCAGVTLWGYVLGRTWVDNSGLYRGSQERPAMSWIKEYMETDKAKQAKSPFPGMKKRVGVYVKPKDLKVAKGDVLPIKVRTFITDDAKAEKADIAIEKVELYVGSELIATMTEEPYITEYSTNSTGTKTLKAIVYTNDGNQYERYSQFSVLTSTTKREPYNETVTELPGTVNTTEYDKGASGVTYSNASRSASTATKDGAWMEYTVDVKEDGIYSFDAEVAASKAGGAFHISEYGLDDLTFYSGIMAVPATGGNSNFQKMHSVLKKELTAGRHTLCLNIDKGGFCIKSLSFSRYEEDKTISVTVSSVKPATISVGDKTTITVTSKSTTSTIDNVKIYANNLLIGTLTEAPYTLDFEPAGNGSYTIYAIATDAEGKVKTSATKTLKVNAKRSPYSTTAVSIPGVIQAENYDKGGEGLAYHDADEANQGDASFRTDEGVDIVKGNGGKAVGYTSANEWIEYSVNVKEPGEYECTATVSSGTTGSGFTLGLVKGTSVTSLCKIDVPQTGNSNWDTYKTVTAKLSKQLTVGEQVLRITINGANCNIDKLQLKCTLNTGIVDVDGDSQPTGSSYNLSGQKVGSGYRGIVIRNGRKQLKK